MNANRRKINVPSYGGVAAGRGGFKKMTTGCKKRISLFFSAITCCLLISGCDSSARRDAADERNPQVQKGLEQAQLKHWGEAIRQFESALTRNANLARPNLELALIYHQQKKNYVRAIYHYECYLEKRPTSEKRQLLLGWIGQARISFVAEIGQSTGGVSEELVRLTRENNLLRAQLKRQGGTGPAVTKTKTLITEPPAGARQAKADPSVKPPIAPQPSVAQKTAKRHPTPVNAKSIERIQIPAPATTTYTVQPGDTLTRIAKIVSGDGRRWKEIYAANMDKMKNENDLKAGQTIIIPNFGK